MYDDWLTPTTTFKDRASWILSRSRKPEAPARMKKQQQEGAATRGGARSCPGFDDRQSAKASLRSGS